MFGEVADVASGFGPAVLGFAWFMLVLGIGSMAAILIYARLEWMLEKMPRGRRLKATKQRESVTEYRKTA